jgi:hypothetical protein
MWPDFNFIQHQLSRNWRDNPKLVARSRSKAIDAIEKTKFPCHLKTLFQERGLSPQPFRWEFKSFYSHAVAGNPELKGFAVEWRNTAAIRTADDAIQWATFVVSFVRGSLECNSSAQLQQLPPNHEGLRQLCTGRPLLTGSTTVTRRGRQIERAAQGSLSSHHNDPPTR